MDDTKTDKETQDDRVLTIAESRALLGGHRALDGRQIIEAGERIMKSYRFTGGKIHYAIAYNITKLERVEKDYTTAHNALVKATFGDKPPAEQQDKMEQFQREALAITEQPGIKIGALRKLNFNDLNIDENQIPGSVLAALLPICIGTPTD